jgi:SAM-dependent methyltransferase
MKATATAFDYDKNEHDYAQVRKADSRIFEYIRNALDEFTTILNVGAGTGSYEPADKYVISVEPSSVMRKKRLALGKNPAVDAYADKMPFEDASFDASLAILTIHHWPNLRDGLMEMKRVTRKKMVILTYDPKKLSIFWNADYFPKVIEVEERRYPEISAISSILGVEPTITNVQIPLDCTDGFQEAFYGRPEYFLDKRVRQAQSAWGFIDQETELEYVKRLRSDLENGDWDKKYGQYRKMPFFDGAYRMLEYDVDPASERSCHTE